MDFDSIKKYSSYGIAAGSAVCIAPLGLSLLLTSNNLSRSLITQLFISIISEGQFRTVFGLAMTSPLVWKATAYCFLLGIPIILLSGAVYAIASLGKKHFSTNGG